MPTDEWCDELVAAKACEAFFTCMGSTAWALISGYLVTLLLLLVFSAIFLVFNTRDTAQKKALMKKLTFHSPDDSPREFKQSGYRYSLLGAILLNFWVVFFAVGYVYSVVASVLNYADDGGILWWKNMPDFMQKFLKPCYGRSGRSGYQSFMGPYCIIMTLTHILWIILSLTWDSLRIRFMTPTDSLGDDATHVLIEEDLDFDTDADLADPDSGGLAKVRGMMKSKSDSSTNSRMVVNIDRAQDGSASLEYTCVRYIFDTELGRFRPRGTVSYTPMEMHDAIDAGGITSARAQEQQAETGRNEIRVHVPGIFEALIGEFADFTYAFNSIGTWSYLVYSSWNIGIFWLIMTISSGSYRSLGIVRPNQQKIAEMAQLTGMHTVLRDSKWVQREVADLVLGDVIRVKGNGEALPVDGIVVQGSLVVDEAMLTGEPMPIQKMPVDRSVNASTSKKNIAYSGTKCMQSVGPSEGQAVMVATSVGALTTRGQLVRMVLFPTSVRFRYTDQMPIVYGIVLIYMAMIIAVYLSPLMDIGDWISKYMMLLNTVAMCLSPMLPVSLVMGQSVASTRLKDDHQIKCLQPARIPIAGKISTIVFDKTGTITKDGMDFDSVVGVDNKGKLADPIKIDGDNPDANPEKIKLEVPSLLRYSLAACHTVTTLQDGTFVGNAVEVSMVKATGWKIHEDRVDSPSGDESLSIAKKLDFDHKRMTSGVIVVADGQLVVYVKGSYEMIQSISKPETVPSNYGSVTEDCAKNGYYVLGIATKTMPLESREKLLDMTRDDIEEGLSVCGLLLFRNEMKKTSPQAIHELKAGGIRSVICTGDNALTGISIGRQCGIVTTEEVLLGEMDANGATIEWRDPDTDLQKVDISAPEYMGRNLAVTQQAWRHLHRHTDELDTIWTRLTVFARMKPEDKINVVKSFQGRGLVVGMAGDGGNDCGGLRAAHAGLALSEAEASMVSPFSTSRDEKTLLTMVDVVREGRACLATNIGTFTYFMVYCFTLTTIRMILGLDAALNFGEFVWFLQDVGLNIFLVWTMTRSGPAEGLGKYRPTATLLGPRTIAGVVYPYVVCVSLFLFTRHVLLPRQDFWEETGGSFHPINDIGLPGKYWMLRGDNYVSPVAMGFLFLTLVTTAFVNTYGCEFRISILKNYSMMCLHGLFFLFMFCLIWMKPTRWNCIFRVSCDTDTSLASGGMPSDSWFWRTLWGGIGFWSAGGIGDCFQGPQLRVWQKEWQTWLDETTTDTTIKDVCVDTTKSGTCTEKDIEIPRAFIPGKNGTAGSFEGGCYPYFLEGNLTWLPPVGTLKSAPDNPSFTPKSSEQISTSGHSGLNNCYTTAFKSLLTAMLLAHIGAHHLYVKFVLNGAVVERFRKQKEELEMQDMGGGKPLL